MSHSHFVPPVKYYIGTFVALLFLTFVTVAVSLVDLGSVANIALALLVAGVKAGLVATFFMGLRWDKGFNALILVGSFVFVFIFLVFTAGDIFLRKATDPLESQVFNIKTKIKPMGNAHNSGHIEVNKHPKKNH